jgi:membrane-bound ClpP family serine protease
MTDAWALVLSLPVGLLLLGFLSVVLEVFVPSGGLFSLVAVGCLVGAIALGFAQFGETYGAVMLLAVGLGAPAVLIWALSVWPETPPGRQMVLHPPNPGEWEPWQLVASRGVELVGKVGRARTELLPGGIVRVGDWELPAISTVAPVARDEQVRILEVRAGYVLVTPAEIEKFEPPS